MEKKQKYLLSLGLTKKIYRRGKWIAIEPKDPATLKTNFCVDCDNVFQTKAALKMNRHWAHDEDLRGILISLKAPSTTTNNSTHEQLNECKEDDSQTKDAKLVLVKPLSSVELNIVKENDKGWLYTNANKINTALNPASTARIPMSAITE